MKFIIGDPRVPEEPGVIVPLTLPIHDIPKRPGFTDSLDGPPLGFVEDLDVQPGDAQALGKLQAMVAVDHPERAVEPAMNLHVPGCSGVPSALEALLDSLLVDVGFELVDPGVSADLASGDLDNGDVVSGGHGGLVGFHADAGFLGHGAGANRGLLGDDAGSLDSALEALAGVGRPRAFEGALDVGRNLWCWGDLWNEFLWGAYRLTELDITSGLGGLAHEGVVSLGRERPLALTDSEDGSVGFLDGLDACHALA